jgi:hypothetical protein
MLIVFVVYPPENSSKPLGKPRAQFIDTIVHGQAVKRLTFTFKNRNDFTSDHATAEVHVQCK